MESGPADERADFAQDAVAQLLERQVAMFLDDGGQSLFAEWFAGLIHRFRHTVGEEKHDIAGAQRLRHLFEEALEPLAVVNLQTEHETVWRLDLCSARTPYLHADAAKPVWTTATCSLLRPATCPLPSDPGR